MMKKSNSDTKIIKIKDIMRLFLKYDVDYIPVIDNFKKLKGLIDKNLIIQDSHDVSSIDKPFFKNINSYIFYPDEDEFLQIVGNLKETINFPVISTKGILLFLWCKKDLLNIYYNIIAENKPESKSTDLNFKDILSILPFNLLIINMKREILFANNRFLEQFDFVQDIIIDKSIRDFFPKIQIINSREMLFPKIYTVTYRHMTWYYAIFNHHSFFIYLFSLHPTIFQLDGVEDFIPIDKVEVDLDKIDEGKKLTASLPDILDNEESQLIKKALETNEWNITRAAQSLNIPRQTLQYKISKYKII